ncbi:MAG TPA: carbon-nitrogen hydrolase family protein [Candidatus Egerieimonas intestinavium]|uniref:Carbon-nitrogen hydrolase family protein n=1 Tax=Candidatus Egerieimonas intestinavium TaxID=2840777 RepID=A0A9D1EI19_9FIRM|nr:carbon-nitrogen hydrolase family protein [Candidatus Egerieimonas intestinavium]
MKDFQSKTCRIALVQGSPVMFDKEKTVQKAVEQIKEAAEQGAKLIVFPESYIPCYPLRLTFGFTVGARTEEGREDWKKYYDNSVVVPGPSTECLAQAAKKYGVFVSIGITERDAVNATLYCTNLIFSPEGELVAKHRKLKPTGAERFIWGDGYEGAFPVVETPWGIMGSLICWENYMPLARAALYEKGISIYLAPNTNDNPEWQDTIKHIAIEGHCYVINVDQYITKSMYPDTLHCQEEIEKIPEEACIGGSCVIDPYGHYVTEPVWNRECIIYADLDMEKVPMSRMEFDGVGHYSRPDVIRLQINE